MAQFINRWGWFACPILHMFTVCRITLVLQRFVLSPYMHSMLRGCADRIYASWNSQSQWFATYSVRRVNAQWILVPFCLGNVLAISLEQCYIRPYSSGFCCQSRLHAIFVLQFWRHNQACICYDRFCLFESSKGSWSGKRKYIRDGDVSRNEMHCNRATEAFYIGAIVQFGRIQSGSRVILFVE